MNHLLAWAVAHRLPLMLLVAVSVVVALWFCVPKDIPTDWADVRSLDRAREDWRQRNTTSAPVARPSRMVTQAKLRRVSITHRT